MKKQKYIAFLGDEDVGIYPWIKRLNQLDDSEIEYKKEDARSEKGWDENFFRLEPKSNIVILKINKEFYLHGIGKIYLDSCKEAIALFYDITNLDSFNSLDGYVEKIQQRNPPSNIILVGTHADETDKRKITKNKAIQKAANIAKQIFPNNPGKEIKTIEVSAKDPGCHNTCSIIEFKNLINKMLNYDFTFLIVALLGASSGGTGSYYGGHAIVHHHASLIISFLTIIGTVISGGFSGMVGYIATQPSLNDGTERQTRSAYKHF